MQMFIPKYFPTHHSTQKSSTRWCWLLVLIFFSEKAQAKKIVFGASIPSNMIKFHEYFLAECCKTPT